LDNELSFTNGLSTTNVCLVNNFNLQCIGKSNIQNEFNNRGVNFSSKTMKSSNSHNTRDNQEIMTNK